MIDLTKCVVDISNWDSISIFDKKTGDNITNLSVGDVSMLSFVYLGDKIYFGEITLYTNNGTNDFYPDKWNCTFGGMD